MKATQHEESQYEEPMSTDNLFGSDIWWCSRWAV